MIGDVNDEALFRQITSQMNDLEPGCPTPPPSVEAIADQLAMSYGHVVILVTETDPEKDEAVLCYAWRGGYYAARGMLDRMKDIMRNDGQEENDDE